MIELYSDVSPLPTHSHISLHREHVQCMQYATKQSLFAIQWFPWMDYYTIEIHCPLYTPHRVLPNDNRFLILIFPRHSIFYLTPINAHLQSECHEPWCIEYKWIVYIHLEYEMEIDFIGICSNDEWLLWCMFIRSVMSQYSSASYMYMYFDE